MNFESLSPILLIFFRYAIAGFGVWLVGKGVSDADAATVVDQIATIAAGAIIYAAPQIYSALKRPSVKAMETAKAVDRQIPKGEAVTLKTPGSAPDIIIPAEKKK